MSRTPVARTAVATILAVAVATILAVGVSACGGSGRPGSGLATTTPPGGTTGSTAPAATLTAAVAGLCVARSQAGGDPATARGTFYDRSHDTLHTIARELETVDRGLAARLLEAMQAVEADVSAQPPASTLAVDLDHLIDVTRQGLVRLTVTTGPCR